MASIDDRVWHLELAAIVEGDRQGFSREKTCSLFEAIYRWKADQISDEQFDDKMEALTRDRFRDTMHFADQIHRQLSAADVPWRKNLYVGD